MPHHTPLIATLVAGLVLAFVLEALAHRVRASPIVGYLLAGVLVGPYTPGFVADPAMAAELAEILHDLLSVRAIAIPGALVQMAVATLLGMALAWALAGNSAPIWSSGWRCRSPAPWFCCAPCRSDGSSTPSRDASPSVG
jgi:CPA2 family monovalent cation:H+ antiporter-2